MSNNKQSSIDLILSTLWGAKKNKTHWRIVEQIIKEIHQKEIAAAYSAGYHDAERADSSNDYFNLFYYNETYGGNK
jgi:hypothetical protein